MTTNNVSSSSVSGGIGLFGLAFIVLLVFKLAGLAGASWGIANLSWLVVFSPLLVGFALWLLIVVIVLVVAAVLR